MPPTGASAFSLRIVSLETSMEQPVSGLDVTYSDFRSSQCPRVPVLRVFGSTPSGRKCCAHVHGVFPYFYVPFEAGSESRAAYLRSFAASLDKAINIAVRRSSSSNVMHIFCINIVHGRSFYGFHGNDSEFMKIHMYNPKMVKKAADLLLGGSVMNRVFQPYESHIPFGLQFMMDFNLYGMNFLHALVARRRTGGRLGDVDDLENCEGEDGADDEEDERLTHPRLVDPSPAPPVTHCQVEVDLSAVDILNRLEVDDNLGSNPGLNALWEEEIQRRRELLGEMPPSSSAAARAWVAPPDSPDRQGVAPTDSEVKWRRRFRRFLQERGLLNATADAAVADEAEAAELQVVDEVKIEDEIDDQLLAESLTADASRANVTEEEVDEFLNRSSSPDSTVSDGNDEDNAKNEPGSILDDAAGDAEGKPELQQPPLLVSRASIERVVACSQSFVVADDDDSDGDDDASESTASSDATCEERASRVLDEFFVRSPSSSQEATSAAGAKPVELNESQRDLFAVEDYDEEESEPGDIADDEEQEEAGEPQLDRAAVLQLVCMEERDSVLAAAFSTDSDGSDEADEAGEEAGDEESVGVGGRPPPQLDGAHSSSSSSSASDCNDDEEKEAGDEEECDDESGRSSGRKRSQPPPPPPQARRGRRLGLSMATRPTSTAAPASLATKSTARTPVFTRSSAKAFKPVVAQQPVLSGRPVLLGKRRSAAPSSPPSPPPPPPVQFSPSVGAASFALSDSFDPNAGHRPLTSTQQHLVDSTTGPLQPAAIQHSASAIESSGSDLQHPGSDLQHPGSDHQHPGSDLQHPGSDHQHPGSDLQHPGSDHQHPGSDHQHPGSDLQHPGSDLQHPGSDHQHPGSDHQHPGSDLQHPGSDHQHPGSDHQHPGSDHQHAESSWPEPSTVPKYPQPLPPRPPSPSFVFAPAVAPPSAGEVASSLASFGLYPCRNPLLRPDAGGIADLIQFDSLAVGPAGLASFDRAAALTAAPAGSLIRYRPLIDPPSRSLVVKSLSRMEVAEPDPPEPPLPSAVEVAPSVGASDTVALTSTSNSELFADLSSQATAAAVEGDSLRLRKQLLAKVKAKVRRSLSETSAATMSTSDSATEAASTTSAAAVLGGDGLTLASLELVARARSGLLPDPRHDAVVAAFLTVAEASESDPAAWRRHCLFVDDSADAAACRIRGFASADRQIRFLAFDDEASLFEALAETVRSADPDVVLGFDTQRGSWGYLIDRSKRVEQPSAAADNGDSAGLPMAQLLSRYRQLPQQQQQRRRREFEANCSSQSQQPAVGQSEEGLAGSYEAQSDSLRIGGRVVINLWRLLRYELNKLRSHSFEACAAMVLNRRYPCYQPDLLWKMWQDGREAWRVLDHLETRSCGSLRMLSSLGLVSRTAEFARIFGIEFYHVLSRGSQYRVESMMLRLAKPLGLLPLSPSVQQRARQAAPDAIPLTLEPRSGLHTDPVVVLDFQSLYPSIMIAYNYCFSTCIGRAASITTCDPVAYEFGCYRLMTDPGAYQRAADHLNFSPLGIGFVDASVQRGVISRMVEEILATRLMVKAAMKRYRGNEPLMKLLDARQLGLKLIANVTYGYTAASFSGRMPCVEVGDSIVRKARETLERAIALVQSEPSWRAQVIYGDTDSLFVLLPGRSRSQAFEIGQAMARAVTADNPKPVKLRFEKVYQPCLLLTKKHYAGFMYETADQKEPVFDAKGIETVRRDSCPLVSRILGRSLRELFSSLDLARVRRLVERELHRLHWGRSPLQELLIAREHRGLRNYSDRAAVPGLAVVRRRLAADPRSEPPIGYRVQFAIVRPAQPGQTLCSRARSPEELLAGDWGPECIDLDYYAAKQILPPLHRALSLLGVDVFAWHAGLAKPGALARLGVGAGAGAGGAIGRFLGLGSCRACGQPGASASPLCPACSRAPWAAGAGLLVAAADAERRVARLADACAACQSGCLAPRLAPFEPLSEAACRSADCPVAFERWAAGGPAARGRLDEIRQLVDELLAP